MCPTKMQLPVLVLHAILQPGLPVPPVPAAALPIADLPGAASPPLLAAADDRQQELQGHLQVIHTVHRAWV